MDRAAGLEPFVLAAVERNNYQLDVAIDNRDREGGSSHRSSVWWFASELKGHAALKDLSAADAVRRIEEVLQRHDGWEALPNVDVWENCTDPRDDFIELWDVIQKPLGAALHPRAAIPLSDEWPLQSEEWSSPADEQYRRAVTVCFWFASLLDGGGRFFLPVRILGELLGVSHRTAAKYLRRAERDGLLERVEDHTTVRARRFRFRFDAINYAES